MYALLKCYSMMPILIFRMIALVLFVFNSVDNAINETIDQVANNYHLLLKYYFGIVFKLFFLSFASP